MADRLYNWRRFWCPPEGVMDLSDGGYLSDPEAEWPLQRAEVVGIEAIESVPCLGLLGEPGIGKSAEMSAQYRGTAQQASAAGDKALWFNLRNYQSDGALCQDIFAHADVMAWQEGTHHLHLYLDSFDEGLLSVEVLGTLLPARLDRFRPHLARLSLRVACRSAEWPGILDAGLRELWGNESVQTYELCPLRRRDVREAAVQEGVAPDAFLTRVERQEAVPLAIKPITLKFLLNMHGQPGRFPRTKSELYKRGCRILCEEHSESRRASRKTGALSPDERLVVAARIAALTVYGNRAAVWTGADLGDAPESDLHLRDVCGDTERISGQAVGITEAAVREVLDTGLFSSRGMHRMGWAHQSYAEFLAAWYVAQHGMPFQQLKGLIVHPGAPDGRIVPQLHETAAWLATLSEEVRDYLAVADPQVLLQSDLGGAGAAARAAITQALLNRFDERTLGDWERGFSKRYDKLAHPGLANQLRPYIEDQRKGWLVRRVAIDMAEACQLRDLQRLLVAVALDCEDDHATRVQAAYAVRRIADDDVKAALRPLAGGGDDDANDELKGCALAALWPHHLAARELFDLVTPPKRPNFWGAYEALLTRDVAAGLGAADLPLALDWVSRGAEGGMWAVGSGLADAILLRAWDDLGAQGVLDGLARAAVALLRAGQWYSLGEAKTRSRLVEDDAKRLSLVSAMLPLMADRRDDLRRLFDEPAIVTRRDLPWLVRRLQEVECERTQATIAALIGWLFFPTDPDDTDLVFRASQGNAVLWEQVHGWFETVLLDAERLRRIEEEQRRDAQREEQRRELARRRPDPTVLIPRYLSEFESGDANGWWRLNYALAIDRESGRANELEPDLASLPGWTQVAELGEERVLRAGRAYLEAGDPETESWLGSDTAHRAAWGGYRAMRLLFARDRESLCALPGDVWRKWAASILAYPISGSGDDGVHLALVATAYAHAPDEVIHALDVLIDKDARQHGYVFIIREVAGCWDARLGAAVLAKVQAGGMPPRAAGHLLEEMIRHGVLAARTYAESLLSLPLPTGEDSRAVAAKAAGVLILLADDCGWPTVWPALQADPDLARTALSRIADDLDLRREPYLDRLSDGQLADLYICVAQLFPHAEDPDIPGVHSVGTREHVGDWRESILASLKARGTFSAVGQVGRIVQALPEADFLVWHLREAEEAALRKTWEAPSPKDVAQLGSSHDKRLIQSADQLLDLVAESLERLQVKLHDEVPAVVDLWDSRSRTPKGEEDLSDYVVRHLKDDVERRGVIVNREAQIHRGERTDIHVDAVSARVDETYETVSIIVEVKGCWNPDLKTAMATQLVGQYLEDNVCRHGLYLVLWFRCEYWEDSDGRKGDTPRWSLKGARTRLERQAADLSTGGLSLRAVVLDGRIRQPARKRRARARRAVGRPPSRHRPTA